MLVRKKGPDRALNLEMTPCRHQHQLPGYGLRLKSTPATAWSACCCRRTGCGAEGRRVRIQASLPRSSGSCRGLVPAGLCFHLETHRSLLNFKEKPPPCSSSPLCLPGDWLSHQEEVGLWAREGLQLTSKFHGSSDWKINRQTYSNCDPRQAW